MPLDEDATQAGIPRSVVDIATANGIAAMGAAAPLLAV
jgi:hypothetical protein